MVIFAVLVVLGLAAAFSVVYHYSQDLPDNRALQAYVPPITTRLHAANGDLIAEYAVENRLFLPIEEIPPRVKQAFLAAEDKNFYHHRGLDFVGLARAAAINVPALMTGRRLVGGSTITQQVAKNFSLSGEVSIDRKIKEAILAFRIERALPKDRILELYLNDIYLGSGAYGVAAAAMKYFGKSLDDVTVAEAAYLAGLPKAPSNYHPVRDHDDALVRRDWVIGRMIEDGHITTAEGAVARVSPLETRDLAASGQRPAPWFAEQVRRKLAATFGSDALYEGGLSVRTTMDPRLQTIAQRVLRDGLETYDRRHGYREPLAKLNPVGDWRAALADIKHPDPDGPNRLAMVQAVEADGAILGFADGSKGRISFKSMKWAGEHNINQRLVATPKRATDVLSVGNVVLAVPTDEESVFRLAQVPAADGALVAIDPYTGRVLAMVGGYNTARSEFNRAVQAVRQPGSAFKPFVYLTALNNGYTPSSIVLDAPFVQRNDLVLGSGWKPGNYSSGRFYGPSPLRLGLELSRNLMTVRLANYIGMAKIAETAARFGVIDAMEPVLAMALGSGATTLLRITTAYAMLVNGGRRIKPAFIDRVQDRHGKTLLSHETRDCPGCASETASLDVVPLPPVEAEQVDDPIAIFQVVTMLQGVVERGTATVARLPGVPLAGKTGTTNNALDAWFVGFSSDLAVGVFVGFDQPRTLGPYETGGKVAAPIFGAFMKEAKDLYPTLPFRAPDGARLMRVSTKDGRPASGANTIFQVFRPGTEPKPQGAVPNGASKRSKTEADKAGKKIGEIY